MTVAPISVGRPPSPIPPLAPLAAVLAELRSNSAEVDREGAFPWANWHLLQGSDLLGLAVPEEFGGRGSEVTYWLGVVRQVGMACPSTGLSLLMHLCATSVIAATGSEAVRREVLPGVAAGRTTVAYAGTERSTGTNFWALASCAREAPSGWRLTLRKDWATLAEVADLFVVPTRAHPDAAPTEISLFLVQRAAGVEAWGRWNGSGMRGSSSGAVSIDAQVPASHLMGTPGRANDYITTDMFNLLLLSHASLYQGVAEEAFRLAAEHARGRRFAHTATSLAETSLWQSHLGQLASELAASRRLIEAGAAAVESGECAGTLLRDALAAKVSACAVARRATDQAMQISGGSGYNQGQRVEMLWRDARAGSLMRPSDEVATMILGRLETGQDPFGV